VTAGRSPDVSDWDAFVEQAEQGSYLQLSPWAAVKAVNGWQAFQVASGDAHRPSIGAQVLVRRPRPLPWAFAYAPRGPVARAWSAETIKTFTDDARRELARSAGRVSHLRIDPEIEADGVRDPDGALRDGLRAAGWRSAPPIQPTSTRVIDLTEPEDALWSGLRKKWRQYVNKARTAGVTVVDGGAEDLATFYRIYRETADRAGFLIRTESAYRDVWQAFATTGRARLLFANSTDGEPVAALFLIRCGARVVEPYGGMTQAGAESRANYLLKWEAIRSSREHGAGIYDLWGLAHPGIAHFKTGFGGREVRYIGAWDLVLDPLGRQVYGTAQAARVWWARRRRGLGAGGSAAEFGGGEGG
jgi:peptidoglycan pentaglycine glycine transferase (the first glycine)